MSNRKAIGKSHLFKKQLRHVLRNSGMINPEDIYEYIANDGYMALGKVLSEMDPLTVIETIKSSGLRGRGGGGFPTGLKWMFAYNAQGDSKYVICNADEGDPGAFMDRSVMEGDPHVLLEAMAIAGYAIGANQGYIYIRAEYPTAIRRLNIAIDQAKSLGLLGKDLFSSGFDFDIELKLGAGAFVCGEETAMIASIEGERGIPRPRPPFPANKGLFGKPTILNNVETFANIPQIILRGGEWFAGIGTEKSKGTKVFALGGRIQNTGLIEVPMGTTLKDIIYDIGGGMAEEKAFKAVQIGGPSGGCLTHLHLDVPIDYDQLIRHGAMMGSGGMIVMDEDNCMVDVARFFLEFTVDESCGKCTPCREGTRRMLEILERICEGQGSLYDLDKLESMAKTIKRTSLCGLGQTAPNPVLSTIRYFKHEYLAHIERQVCPAGVCKSLITYHISDDCIGCGKCKKVCPVQCIRGELKDLHVIGDTCVKCGVCVQACPVSAISKY